MELLPLESAEPKAVQTALMGILSPAQQCTSQDWYSPLMASRSFSVGRLTMLPLCLRMAEALDLGGADVPAIRTLRIRPSSFWRSDASICDSSGNARPSD